MKRTRLVVLILCAGFVSAAWGQQPRCKHPSPWGEFHRQNMHRWNPCENVLNVHNVGNLSLKWSYDTGDDVYSSLAVANGVVYVLSWDKSVYALDAGTGGKLWSYATRGSVYFAPTVVYLGSTDNNVYALNASTGTKVWSYRMGFFLASSPAVANGVVYVSSHDDNVYAT